MFERVDVRRRWLRTDARTMAASEEEPTATLLDQTARQPAQQEEFARIRVADLGVAKEDPTIALRHFWYVIDFVIGIFLFFVFLFAFHHHQDFVRNFGFLIKNYGQ